MTDKCPTCGSAVRIEGKTTKYFVPAEHVALPTPEELENAKREVATKMARKYSICESVEDAARLSAESAFDAAVRLFRGEA